jgi:Polyketide cyclase / dehydrase and lipid transport
MRTLRVSHVMPGTVAEAERCWLRTSRWPRWVDGLARVLAVDTGWPAPGTAVRWESGPAGRGQVTERVVTHEPLESLAVEVEDPAMRGRQTVTFSPDPEEVEVTLTLEYELRRRSIVTPLIDLLFIRRAMTVSLQTTLRRFAFELEASRRGRRD